MDRNRRRTPARMVEDTFQRVYDRRDARGLLVVGLGLQTVRPPRSSACFSSFRSRGTPTRACGPSSRTPPPLRAHAGGPAIGLPVQLGSHPGAARLVRRTQNATVGSARLVDRTRDTSRTRGSHDARGLPGPARQPGRHLPRSGPQLGGVPGERDVHRTTHCLRRCGRAPVREFMLRPLTTDIARSLPPEFEPDPPRLALHTKAILPVPGRRGVHRPCRGRPGPTPPPASAARSSRVISLSVGVSVVAVALYHVLAHAFLDPIDQLTEATRRVHEATSPPAYR